MAIQKEVWIADIKEKLFPDNSWMAQSVDESAWSDGKKVHRPNAGALPAVTRNRSSYPAVAVPRTDIDNEYSLDEFTSDPSHITDIDEIETNYNKRSSVVGSHAKQLNLQCANWLMYHWAATQAANITRTTGAARPAIGANYGATGNRKKLEVLNVLAVGRVFDNMDLSEEGRNLLLPADMYNDLVELEWKTLLELQAEGTAVLRDKKLIKLFGFNIWKRGAKNLLTYTNASTPVRRAPDAANLATVNVAALAWHNECVARAMGDIKVYEDIDNPLYYGSIFSAMARLGGQVCYTDQTGVAAIVEDAAA